MHKLWQWIPSSLLFGFATISFIVAEAIVGPVLVVIGAIAFLPPVIAISSKPGEKGEEATSSISLGVFFAAIGLWLSYSTISAAKLDREAHEKGFRSSRAYEEAASWGISTQQAYDKELIRRANETAARKMKEAAAGPFDYIANVKVDHTHPPYKHALLVRLNRRATEAELRRFAEVQREKNPASKYDKLFISYLLVGQPEGSGLWASSHWTPDLQIEIVGQSIEQARSTNRHGFVKLGEELVGAWSGIGNEIIVVLRRNGRAYFRKQSDEAVYGEHEVTEKGRNYFLNSEGSSYSLFEISRDGILVWKLPDGTISYEFTPF